MKVLLTAFEPFRGRVKNGSEEILNILEEKNIPEVQYVKVPVSYDEAFKAVEKRILIEKPDFIIALGESQREALYFEALAFNQMHSKSSDNSGQIYELMTIDQQKSWILESHWNINELNGFFKESPYPFDISFHAGTYVCNRLYFDLLVNEEKYKYRACFIHCPLYKSCEETKAQTEGIYRFILTLKEKKNVFIRN